MSKISSQSIVIFLILHLFSNSVVSQQITHTKIIYKNDSIIISYDVIGRTDLDSIWLIISGAKNIDSLLSFTGAINKPIKRGKNKKTSAYVDSNLLKDAPLNLKINLEGNYKSESTKKGKKKKHKKNAHFISSKAPKLSVDAAGGFTMPMQDNNELSLHSEFSINYFPVKNFSISIGADYRNIKALNSFMSFPIYYKSTFYFPTFYASAKYGFSPAYSEHVLAVGLGKKFITKHRIAYSTAIELQHFYEHNQTSILNFTLGINYTAIQRKTKAHDRNYRFKNQITIPEISFSYLNALSASLNTTFYNNYSPFFIYGIGFGIDYFNTLFKEKPKGTYYSYYYGTNREFYYQYNEYHTKFTAIKGYLSARLFFTAKKIRPYIQSDFGYAGIIQSKNNLTNGFCSLLSLGTLFPINKQVFTFSVGAKYYYLSSIFLKNYYIKFGILL